MKPLRPIERGTASDGPIRLPPQWDHADTLQIETTPLVPEANQAFSPHELDARLEALAEIVAAEQPVEMIRSACWGCGRQPPTANKWPQHPSKVPGWVVRAQEHASRFHQPEVWCPDCAALGGFGCVEETKIFRSGMKLINRQTKANTAAARWSRQYRDSSLVKSANEVAMRLVALGDNPDPDEVDRIIGNTSWTRVPECDQCRGQYSAVIQLGNEDDYDSSLMFLCRACLERAVEMLPSSEPEPQPDP